MNRFTMGPKQRSNDRGRLPLKRGLRIAAIASVFALGCSSSLTELIVVVDSDLAVPGELQRVTLEVTGPSGNKALEDAAVDLAMDGAPALPLTLSLTPGSDALEPVTITAVGTGPAGRVERTVVTGFVRGERRVVRLWLLRACLGVDCTTGETCGDDGICVDATVPPEDLPPWTGTPPGIDGGTIMDAAADAAMDAGTDGPVGTDAGCEIGCDTLDDWYDHGATFACCNGSVVCSACQEQRYREHFCSGDTCSFNVTGSRLVHGGCGEDCSTREPECDDWGDCSGACPNGQQSRACYDWQCSAGACDLLQLARIETDDCFNQCTGGPTGTQQGYCCDFDMQCGWCAPSCIQCSAPGSGDGCEALCVL
jgi:hypothetical protein